MFDRMKFRNKIILCLCVAMCVVFGAYAYQLSQKARALSIEEAEAQAELVGGKYGNEVKLNIEKALDASQALVDVIKAMRMSPETMDREVIDNMQKEVIRSAPSFYGIQAVFEPNGLDGQDARYAGAKEWWGKDGRYGQ